MALAAPLLNVVQNKKMLRQVQTQQHTGHHTNKSSAGRSKDSPAGKIVQQS